MPTVANGLQTQFEVTTKANIPMKQTAKKQNVNSSEVMEATDVTDQLTLETSDQSNVLETLQKELKTQIETTDEKLAKLNLRMDKFIGYQMTATHHTSQIASQPGVSTNNPGKRQRSNTPYAEQENGKTGLGIGQSRSKPRKGHLKRVKHGRKNREHHKQIIQPSTL